MTKKSDTPIENRIEIDFLHLDPQNPRLPEEVQGKPEFDILQVLYRDFDLEELAYSITENGYFAEEPIVVVDESRKNKPKFIVVEGNRRISTIKILLSTDLRKKLDVRNWPEASKKIKDHIKKIPAIVYPSRKQMLPYLGVRHIAGIKKWESYAKARYVANMVDEGYSIDKIQNQIGDRQNSARKHYLCYKLVEQAKEEYGIDLGQVKENFSYLMLATGQGSIKRFLGLPSRLSNVSLDNPVPASRLPNLRDLFSWLFGEGKEKSSVLDESRDITDYLSDILDSEEATRELKSSRDIIAAWELSDGEEAMVLKKLRTANKNLELVLGIAHRHKTSEVIEEVEKSHETVLRLHAVITEKE
jgi:hypothetical protein